MQLRVALVRIQVDYINEFDAPITLFDEAGNPKVHPFVGDEAGTALEHAARFLEGVPAQLAMNAAEATLAAKLQEQAAPPSPLDDKTKAYLRDLAKKYGLAVSGNRRELIARITASDQYKADNP